MLKKPWLVFSVVVFGLLFWTAIYGQSRKTVGKITYFEGSVKKKSSKGTKWIPVKMNMKLKTGDWIKTAPEEKLEIRLGGGSVMRISEKSEIQLNSSLKKTSARIKSGRVWANIAKIAKTRKQFEIKTATATAAIRGTILRMNQSGKDSSTTLAVYKGQVDIGPGDKLKKQQQQQGGKGEGRHEISGPTEVPGPYEVSLDDWVRIVAGISITIRQDGKYDKRKINSFSDGQDQWVQFNKERDKKLGLETAE